MSQTVTLPPTSLPTGSQPMFPTVASTLVSTATTTDFVKPAAAQPTIITVTKTRPRPESAQDPTAVQLAPHITELNYVTTISLEHPPTQFEPTTYPVEETPIPTRVTLPRPTRRRFVCKRHFLGKVSKIWRDKGCWEWRIIFIGVAIIGFIPGMIVGNAGADTDFW
jgi:hypothetical protein